MAFQFHRYMRTPHSEIYVIFSSDPVEKGPVGRVVFITRFTAWSMAWC